MKIHRIVCSILTLLLVFSLASCANTPMPENEKDYVIYYYPSAGNLIENEKETTDATFENAETKVFSFSSKTEIDKPHNAENQQNFELNGKTYSLEYSKSYKTALSSSDSLKGYSLFNSYRSDTVLADTRVDTNELLMFTILDTDELIAAGDVTEDEAMAVAESTFLSLYGKESRNEYTCEDTVYTDTELVVQYTVVYRKYVFGIPTNDTVQISVNMKGDVVGINAKSMGMFSSAEEQLSKDSISDALSMLNKTFSDDWNIGTTMLVLDAEGSYYISAQLSRNVSGELEAMLVYINVI